MRWVDLTKHSLVAIFSSASCEIPTHPLLPLHTISLRSGTAGKVRTASSGSNQPVDPSAVRDFIGDLSLPPILALLRTCMPLFLHPGGLSAHLVRIVHRIFSRVLAVCYITSCSPTLEKEQQKHTGGAGGTLTAPTRGSGVFVSRLLNFREGRNQGEVGWTS